jgi:hypothetical protein
MLGISLHIYLYLKLAKTLCLSYYLLCFLFNKIGIQVLPGGRVVGEWGGDGPKQCIHVSKCKNDNNKNKRSRSDQSRALHFLTNAEEFYR